MTKLEQAHYDAMKDALKEDFWGDTDKDLAATNSAAITIAHMKGFAEWLADNCWDYRDVNLYVKNKPLEKGNWMIWSDRSFDISTTEELIELYLKQLP